MKTQTIQKSVGSIIRIQSVKNSTWIAEECSVATTFLSRFIGLMGKRALAEGQGLLLRPCNDIHMWFMKIPIDVVFLKRDQNSSDNTVEVTSVRENLRPWRILPVRDFKAFQTLELPVGTIQRCDLREGDKLCIS
ncbi:MAG: DUF192 domain-containing protein [Bdellovibrionia bacterium]